MINYIPFRGGGAAAFDPVNPSVASLRELGQQLATLADSSGVQDGQSLTVNSQAVGGYHYRVIVGDTTISSFSNNDYFSTVEDTDWEALVVVGNLTISADMIPTLRKLGWLIYVTGNLIINNAVSMTARGANHSAATGSNIAAAAVRIADGTYGGDLVDPEIPAAGGDGGAASSTDGIGDPGANGTGGGVGGGAAGGRRSAGTSGAGAAGTSFSGGPGGGGSAFSTTPATAGASDGGPGGDGAQGANSNRGNGGGAGNPGGAGFATATADDGADGTGGILAIICLGALSGAGTVAADGSDGGAATGAPGVGGGGSGGGSVTMLYGSDSSSITPTANGGVGGEAGQWDGGAGGLGTARKKSIP